MARDDPPFVSKLYTTLRLKTIVSYRGKCISLVPCALFYMCNAIIPTMKRFLEWIGIKQKLDESNHKPPYFKEREIWWASIGENIGSEMQGKNKHFRRPVLILRKLDRYSFICVPLTSKEKLGSWYVSITHSGKNNTVVVSQVRHLDYRRLDKKMATLDAADFRRVLNGLLGFLTKK